MPDYNRVTARRMSRVGRTAARQWLREEAGAWRRSGDGVAEERGRKKGR